jgi:hypothetical protein
MLANGLPGKGIYHAEHCIAKDRREKLCFSIAAQRAPIFSVIGRKGKQIMIFFFRCGSFFVANKV